MPDDATSSPTAPRRRSRGGRTVAAAALIVLAATAAVPFLEERREPGERPPSDDAAAILADAQLALDTYYRNGGGDASDVGWEWALYYMGLEAVWEQTDRSEYADHLLDWGRRNAWNPRVANDPTSNPGSRAAIQVWLAAERAGLPVDLGTASRVMAADLDMPPSTYRWVDAMFLGLPLWPAFAGLTGDDLYLAKHRELYSFLKDDGSTGPHPDCTSGGLFDPSEDLWWRDCSVIGQDEAGRKVFWALGNASVLATMPRLLHELPPGSPDRREYEAMLSRMAERLSDLQGEDGMWRSSLLDPERFPDPETTATALITYAMAYGVREGLLDEARFRPIIDRAWSGLSGIALQDDGFLAYCQEEGGEPRAPSTTESTPQCVGAFALAAAEVALLSEPAPTPRPSPPLASGKEPGEAAARSAD